MKPHKALAAVLVLALATVSGGCSKSAADGPVLARVNRGTITAAEFKKQLEDLAPQMQQAVATDPKARKEFLEDLIGIELVIQEAKRQGMDKTAEFKKRQEMLREEMERRISENAKNELFNSLLKKEIGDKLAKIPAPTDQEVSEYYNTNKEKIIAATGKKVTLKQIEPQLKMRIMQERRRDLYLDYAKGLKAKATISVDDKALDAAAADLTKKGKELDLSHLNVKAAPDKTKAK